MRFRLTAIAVAVTLLVVTATGIWLVSSVERTLTNEQRKAEHDTIDLIRADLAAGRPINDNDLNAIAAAAPIGQIVQVLDGDRVVATTRGTSPANPGQNTSSPPALTRAASSDTDEIDLPDGAYSVSSVIVPGTSGDLAVLAASPLEPVRQSIRAFRDQLFIVLPLLVATVGLLTWTLAGRALRPVDRIREEVDSITASTLSRRVPVPASSDEVSRLAITMNRMLDRLDDSSQRQRQFIADASHELRSPVAAIRTELEVAQLTATSTDWSTVASQLLTEEGRLERVIEDLLALATLDENDGQPERTNTVDLADVARSQLNTIATRACIEVTCDADKPANVKGHATQLERLVRNLGDNAIRHARTAVHIEVRPIAGLTVLTVDDDGPGVPAKDRERIFERFTRLDDHRARTETSAGAGLGLSLVRRITQVHGGSVVASDSPLGGARFTVRLPLDRSERHTGP